MRPIDIERFEKLEKLLPGVIAETDDILKEMGDASGTVYPAVQRQLKEIKRVVDSRIIPSKEEKERIRVGYIIQREFDGAEKLPEYAEIISEIGHIYSKLGGLPKYKYFADPKLEVEFINKPCECCGSTDYCIDGRYFGWGDRVKSVCGFCLAAGKKRVRIPEALKRKLLKHLREFDPFKTEKEILAIATAEIDELERTPPVPWLTQNEWPVANGDFCMYQYTMGKSMFFDGKKELFESMEGIEKVKDREKLWEEVGEKITVFGFTVIGVKKYTEVAVAQCKDPKTIKAVWGGP